LLARLLEIQKRTPTQNLTDAETVLNAIENSSRQGTQP